MSRELAWTRRRRGSSIFTSTPHRRRSREPTPAQSWPTTGRQNKLSKAHMGQPVKPGPRAHATCCWRPQVDKMLWLRGAPPPPVGELRPDAASFSAGHDQHVPRRAQLGSSPSPAGRPLVASGVIPANESVLSPVKQPTGGFGRLLLIDDGRCS